MPWVRMSCESLFTQPLTRSAAHRSLFIDLEDIAALGFVDRQTEAASSRRTRRKSYGEYRAAVGAWARDIDHSAVPRDEVPHEREPDPMPGCVRVLERSACENGSKT